jgi:hypothetical protein
MELVNAVFAIEDGLDVNSENGVSFGYVYTVLKRGKNEGI